jgi:acyl-coenzyme A synthetase/AMP-(fatty) acid ligase
VNGTKRTKTLHKFSALYAALAAPISLGRTERWLEWDNEMAGAASSLEPAVVEADDPAIMYYTSGSTGYPKRALLGQVLSLPDPERCEASFIKR